MRRSGTLYSIILYFIAGVWLINGLYCKLLNFVPRHQLIVARILGPEYAGVVTRLIGIAEILVALVVLARYKSRWMALFQIVVVLTMNLLEFFLAEDLLLWGRFNLVFAVVFAALIGWHAYYLSGTQSRTAHV